MSERDVVNDYFGGGQEPADDYDYEPAEEQYEEPVDYGYEPAGEYGYDDELDYDDDSILGPQDRAAIAQAIQQGLQPMAEWGQAIQGADQYQYERQARMEADQQMSVQEGGRLITEAVDDMMRSNGVDMQSETAETVALAAANVLTEAVAEALQMGISGETIMQNILHNPDVGQHLMREARDRTGRAYAHHSALQIVRGRR